ncbi:MAG: tetratricopeptide repeat protein [Hyphomicrobiales bacterium]
MSDSRVRRSPFGKAIKAVLPFAMACTIALGGAQAETKPDVADDYPTSLAGNYLAATIADKSRDMAAAAAYYLDALAESPDDPDLIDRALPPLLAAGKIKEAVELASRRTKMEGESRLSQLVIGVDALKARQYASARTALQKSGAGPIAELISHVLVAWSLQGAGDTDAALKLIDEKLKNQDWYASFTEFHAGLIAELAGRQDEAMRRMGKAYEADPGVLRVVEAYAEIKQRAGDNEGVAALFKAVTEKVPNHPLIQRDLELLKDGKPLPPIATNVQEGAAHLLYDVGSAIGRDGGEELAAIYLQLALHLNPKFDLAIFGIGDLFEAMKQYEMAILTYDSVPKESPLRRSAMIQAALDLDVMDRPDEARERVQPLVDADPGDLEAVTALGNILRARKDFAGAAAVYTRGLDTLAKPEAHHWMLYYFRGICHERTKEWPKAEADFKKALELEPEQPLVLNYLGYSWVDQGMNLDEALDMIKKAVELRGDDGYIVDSLGWVYYKLGRFNEAVEELEKAVTLRPEDPLINDHLGDAYWRVGRRLEARFQWSHARDLKPEAEELPRILRKLEVGLDAAGATPEVANEGPAGGSGMDAR